MMKTSERIRWAVTFAYVDLSGLRVLDLLGLREELLEVLQPREGSMRDIGGILVTPLATPLPGDYEAADFLDLQKTVRGFLEDAAGSGTRKVFPPGASSVTTGQVSQWDCNIKLSLIPSKHIGVGVILQVTGPTKDVFLYRLFEDLRSAGTHRLERCEHCNHVFFKFGRKRYCGRACANRQNYERWVDRQNQAPQSED